MKLARFNYFVENVNDHDVIVDLTNGQRIYRIYDGEWFEENGAKITNPTIIQLLNRAQKSDEPYFPRGSKRGYFWVDALQLNCIVELSFTSRPQRDKKMRCVRALQKSAERAEKEYDAQHSEVTGLPNKKAFETFLQSQTKKAIEAPNPEEDDSSPLISRARISLIAGDIDFFKQVNDTFGHSYGDIVLEMVARRFEECAERLKKTNDTNVEFFCAHPSGEEFFIAMTGVDTKASEIKITDEFRLAIASSPLPSLDEWRKLEPHKKPIDFDLPVESERIVTVSLGVASINSFPENSDPRTLTSQLIKQADTSMYRAKAAGRNTVRHFSDILSKNGRILEHHPDTKVVTIDIGRSVSVAEGQEFIVIHPDFTGDVPFKVHDGRSERTLGMRPKKSIGQIVVTHVDSEVSFCEAQECTTGLFPEGCLLESVPVGSIGHLISKDTGGANLGVSSLLNAQEIGARIEKLVKSGDRPFVLVINLLNVEKLVQDRGIAYVNRVLASLIQRLHDLLPGFVSVGKIQQTDIAIVADADQFENLMLVQDVINEIHTMTHEMAEFVCGYFNVSSNSTEGEGDSSKFSPEHALIYARYAAQSESSHSASPIPFDSLAAGNVLYQRRISRSLPTIIADYKQLSEIGLDNAHCHNHYALAFMEAGRFDDPDNVINPLERACNLGPAFPSMHYNLATALYLNGHYDEAYDRFRTGLDAAESDKPDNELYYRPFALTMFEAYRSNPTGFGFGKDDVVSMLEEALKNPTVKTFNLDNRIILEAIESLEDPSA